MHINSIISYANIMQLQIAQHEQAHIGHNKQQAAIQQTRPSHQQVNEANHASFARQLATPPIHDTATMRHAPHRPKFQLIYNTQAKIMLNKFN